MSSEKRVPFTSKTPKKVKREFEEPPIVTVTNTPFEEPPKIETEATMGRLDVPEKDIKTETYLGQQTRPLTFAERLKPREPFERPKIYGRGTTPSDLPKEKPVTESTRPELTGQKKVTVDRWADIPLTTPINTLVEPVTDVRSTNYLVEPSGPVESTRHRMVSPIEELIHEVRALREETKTIKEKKDAEHP